MKSLRDRRISFIIASAILCGVAVVLGLSLGAVEIPLSDTLRSLLSGPNPKVPLDLTLDTSHEIIWKLRFPRVLMAFLEGASLSAAGAVMQGLFKNPMADPYVLGVSSGASLGAVVGIITGVGRVLGLWALPSLSFVFALLSVALVYVVSRRNGRLDTWSLLLSGIALSSLVSSLIALLMVIFRERLDEIVFWTMGGLSRATWPSVLWTLVYGSAGFVVIWWLSYPLNAISLGDEPAFHLGIPVERVKKWLLWASALITASSVAFTGPVGFVGLVVPHTVRLLIGPDHFWLLPSSALFGGSFLILADLLARTLASPLEIPTGVVTALFGAPFFLYLLKTSRR